MGSVRAFVVTTVCGSAEEFVERYHNRIEGRSIFVSVIDERVTSGPCAFAILLADKRPILAGVCEVIERFRDAKNEFGRRGMRLGISRLGVESEAIWADLVRRRDRRMARGTPPILPLDEDVDVGSDAIPIEVEDEAVADSVATAISRLTAAYR